jgi:4-hydroxyphenylpyruvate dioxygenase
MNSTTTEPAHKASNPLGVKGIDHVEFIVEDAEAWRDYYVDRFGMYLRAYGDESTGLAGRKAYLVGQGRVNFLLAQPHGRGSARDELQDHLDKHGNGVKDVAYLVEDAAKALANALAAGARQARAIDAHEGFKAGAIKVYGDTIHTLVERKDRATNHFPGYVPTAESRRESSIHFAMIDHVVANVEVMDEWVGFYERVFGFEPTRHFDINTGRSALMSKVMGSSDGYIKMPINEPSSGNSQIQEYLDEYNGPGVQHIALLTPNIVDTVAAMRRKGMEFLEIPDSYYDEEFRKRLGTIDESVEDLKANQILADRDDEHGYLLQIFTRCLYDRPTLFHEVIQRKGGAKGFGEGNFKALFESIEREQARRGTL